MSSSPHGFDPGPLACREIAARALAEDLGSLGDLTSAALVPPDLEGVASIVSRGAGVVAGTAPATEAFAQIDSTLSLEWELRDGDPVSPGQCLGRVRGRLRSILTAERTALNLLGHLSGVATATRRFVDAAGGGAQVRDTRKTLPGLRALEKAAVRAGGGRNHREGLSDAILVKDNHLRVVGVGEAVVRVRDLWPGRLVEVECDTLEQVVAAKEARVDLVLLDNMSPEMVAEAVALLDGAAPVEVSGGVTLDRVSAYVAAGADFLSVGAITFSASSLDVGLDLD
ncbi:MAG: carboxylating nicotinate-nucleotide diphosphorylase [Acidimicrobiia bacterium]